VPLWEVGRRVKKTTAEVIDADNPDIDQEYSKQKIIQAAIDQISRKHGKETVMWLGRENHNHVEVVPTGSLNLDIALGVGGLPKVSDPSLRRISRLCLVLCYVRDCLCYSRIYSSVTFSM